VSSNDRRTRDCRVSIAVRVAADVSRSAVAEPVTPKAFDNETTAATEKANLPTCSKKSGRTWRVVVRLRIGPMLNA
jgi:hypothetical protein